MTSHIIYHPQVNKDISGIPQNRRVRIKKAIEERLSIDPLHYGLPLRRGLQGYRKLRVGDYCIIYQLGRSRVTILRIGHRKEVYQSIYSRET